MWQWELISRSFLSTFDFCCFRCRPTSRPMSPLTCINYRFYIYDMNTRWSNTFVDQLRALLWTMIDLKLPSSLLPVLHNVEFNRKAKPLEHKDIIGHPSHSRTWIRQKLQVKSHAPAGHMQVSFTHIWPRLWTYLLEYSSRLLYKSTSTLLYS